MTTSSNTTGILHTSDAEFRTWLAEFSGMLDSAGFTKSADTGQINTGSATLPSTNTYGGYEIRYLDDSLHATKPLYCKIEYGTQSSSGRPMIRVSCASGTNGSGTLSGTTYMAAVVIIPNSPLAAAGTFFSGAVTRSGYAAFVFKRGYISAVSVFFSVCRTCDSAGAPTTAGFTFYTSSSTLTRTSYVSAATTDGAGFCLFPGPDTTTLVGGAPQVMRHFQYTPQIQCVPFMLSFISSEIGDLSTFTATPVGATQRTYMALGGTNGPLSCGLSVSGALATARLAMQWE